MKLFLILTLCVYSCYANPYVSSHLEPFTDELINAINALNTTWKAGKNFKDPSTVDIDKLVSHERVPYFPHFFRQYVYTGHYEKVGKFDARDSWPNCTSIGKIYDQRKGYPAWIYTAVGTIADRLCIKHGISIDVANTVDKMIRFSGISREYNSANMVQALDYWSKNGIFISEEDSNCLPHSLKCQQNGIKLKRYFNVTNEYYKYEMDPVRDLKLIGPLSAYMLVGADFPMYQSGVYVRSIEKNLGIQNVKLIGSGEENGEFYYIAAGSWGTEWGDKGYFKIFKSKKDFGVSPYVIRTTLEPVDAVPKSFDYGQLFYLAK